MIQYKQKDIRAMSKAQKAEDITYASDDQLKGLIYAEHGLETVGLSFGVYGMNGGVFKGNESGNLYVIVGRASNLFRLA